MAKNKDHHKISAEDLNLKLRFERKFKKKLKDHFKKISSAFKKHYSDHGKIIDPKDHKDFIHKEFLNNYVSVSERFSRRLRDRIGKPDNNGHIQNRIDMAISHESVRNTAMYAQDVVDTTSKNMTSAIEKVITLSLEKELFLSNDEIADQAQDILDGYLDARAPLISTTEVQRAAEDGKFIEINEMENGNAYYGEVEFSEMKKNKIWVSILDDHTRPDHAEADGQEVDIDEPFIVGEDNLMHPGDDSLGAGADQICNCRCNCIYSVENN